MMYGIVSRLGGEGEGTENRRRKEKEKKQIAQC